MSPSQPPSPRPDPRPRQSTRRDPSTVLYLLMVLTFLAFAALGVLLLLDG